MTISIFLFAVGAHAGDEIDRCELLGFEEPLWDLEDYYTGDATADQSSEYVSQGDASLSVSMNGSYWVELEAAYDVNVNVNSDASQVEFLLDVFSNETPWYSYVGNIQLYLASDSQPWYEWAGQVDYESTDDLVTLSFTLPDKFAQMVKTEQVSIKLAFSSLKPTTIFWVDNMRFCDTIKGCIDTLITPPSSMPLPPKKIGCYIGTTDGWQEMPCTPSDEVDLPRPIIAEYAIKTDAENDPEANPDTAIDNRPWNYPEAYERASVNPLEFGQVETTLVTYGGLEDTKYKNGQSVSVQLNTNRFWHESGDGSGPDQNKDYQAVIQFCIQTISGETSFCIWNINVYDAYSYVADAYRTTCFTRDGDLDPFSFRGGAEGDFKQHDVASISASAYIGLKEDLTTTPVLAMVAKADWVEISNPSATGYYAVVAPDYRGLGLKKHWTDISGDILGVGENSQAVFTDSSVMTKLLAGSCVNSSGPEPGIPWPGECPDQPELLDSTYLDINITTAETNNLHIIEGPFALVSESEDIDFPFITLSKDSVFTYYISSTAGIGDPLEGKVFIRDTLTDVGIEPSNYGDNPEPFWKSPDIFIVPENTAVSVDAIIPNNTVLSPGENYDIYVRVHNADSNNTISGVKTNVYLATPSTLSSAWESVTSDQYLSGDATQPAGISVAPSSKALLGPFHWTVPTVVDVDDVHKCMLASIIANDQGEPDQSDAPGSYQVAQRNVILGENCEYWLPNATGQDGNISIVLTVNGAYPLLAGGNVVEITFDDLSGTLYNTWRFNHGVEYSVSNADGKTTVRLGQRRVKLEAVSLNSGKTIKTKGLISLITGAPRTTLNMEVILKDPSTNEIILRNGGSCVGLANPPIE